MDTPTENPTEKKRGRPTNEEKAVEKKPRGRPPKDPVANELRKLKQKDKIPGKRGRPPKVQAAPAVAAPAPEPIAPTAAASAEPVPVPALTNELRKSNKS